MKRMCSGTSVPGPRPSRPISPRRTESTNRVARSQLGAAGVKLVGKTVSERSAHAPMPAFTYRPVLGWGARAMSTSYSPSTPRTTSRAALTQCRRTDCRRRSGGSRIRGVRMWDGQSHKRTLLTGARGSGLGSPEGSSAARVLLWSAGPPSPEALTPSPCTTGTALAGSPSATFRPGPQMRHVTLAFRTLFKTPFVTGIAVVSLALGIGANAAIFSLFDQILLRKLPVPDPDRLVNLADPFPKSGSMLCGQAGSCDVVFSYPTFRDLERSQTVFTGLAAHCVFGVSLSYRDQPTTGEGMYVSGSYFPTLGLRPALGRLLTPADEQSIGTNYVAVLGYGYWQSHFGSDPGVLGRPLRVNGRAMTIVGVTPADFRWATRGVDPLVCLPIGMGGLCCRGF